jgi:hypothetical protein
MGCCYKHQNQNSKFALHLQESHHSIRPTEDIMEVMQVVGQGNFMNVLEKFHIYKETSMNSQFNDKSTLRYNKIFETIIQQNQPRQCLNQRIVNSH